MSSVVNKTDSKSNKGVGTSPVGGRGHRVSRADKGLPELTPSQKMARQQVQGAQNACKFIKNWIDQGHMPSGEVLQACSTLAGAVGGFIGE